MLIKLYAVSLAADGGNDIVHIFVADSLTFCFYHNADYGLLTVVAGGKYEHIHGRDKKLVMARLADIPNASHWTLYKRGAFGMKEREIERGGGR